MTNGEKIKALFPDMYQVEQSLEAWDSWWNAEYKEPTIRNCFGCKYATDNHNSGTEECHLCMWENQYTPITKNNLVVDCISRADVHDMLENLPITVEDKWFNWLQKACMRLAELPSVTPQEPRWIPVSERLPEEDGGYLVTVKQGYVRTSLWVGNAEYWNEVTAWMPLPKPYREVEE